MKKIPNTVFGIIAALFWCCTTKTNKTKLLVDSSKYTLSKKIAGSNDKIATNRIRSSKYADSVSEFEKRVYFNIDNMWTGPGYTNSHDLSLFYRVLEIPEEENIMLIIENISVGGEGGNFRLVKLSRLTDDNSVLPKFGLFSVDSLKFIDSVKIIGYFNHKKMVIDLDKLPNFHPSY
jgi:hypothetical protein